MLNFLAINPSMKSRKNVIIIKYEIELTERLSSINSSVIIQPKKRFNNVIKLGIIK